MKNHSTTIKISYTDKVDVNNLQSMQRAENGWKTKVVDEKGFHETITTYPYGIIVFRDESKREMVFNKKKGIRELKNQRCQEYADAIIPDYIIYDIDNHYKDIEKENGEIINLNEMHEKLDKQNLKYATITTKSHGIKGDNDRYRLFIFLDWEGTPMGNEDIPITPDAFDLPKKSEREKTSEKRRDSLRILWESVAERIGIEKAIDYAALNNYAGKYVPSPKNALYHSKLEQEPFRVLDVAQVSIKKLNELYEHKEAQRKASKLASKNREDVGTYKWFLENAEYSVLVNPRVFYGIDLRDVIAYYEREYSGGFVREYEASSYIYVDVKSEHKYSIMRSSKTGDFTWHDFNTGESGNILQYMQNRLPNEVTGMIRAAIRLKKDFSEAIKSMGEEMLLANPAFYVEKFLALLNNENIFSSEELNAAFLEEAEISQYKLSPNARTLSITSIPKKEGQKGFVTTFDLPTEVSTQLIQSANNFTSRIKQYKTTLAPSA